MRRQNLKQSEGGASLSARVFVGTSGWNYRDWAGGVFYPEGLKPSQWLEYYARHFQTVEINNTFYHLPPKRVFEDWRDRTPVGGKNLIRPHCC